MAKKSKSRNKQTRNLIGSVFAFMPLLIPALLAAVTSLMNNAELRDQRKALSRWGLEDLAPKRNSKKSA